MKIKKVCSLAFPVERVFTAWVSSNTVIPPATSMDIDPVVGGHYRLVVETPEFSSRNEGKFLEFLSGSFIKYTWEWNEDGKITVISVGFSGNEKATTIKLTHAGFDNSDSLKMHSTGWDSYIEGISHFLADELGE